jgi:hypothetical protein
MSFKRVETAADLVRFGCSLRIECTNCFYAITLTGMEVAGIHQKTPLARLQARFKCRRCGKKEARTIVLPPVRPD